MRIGSFLALLVAALVALGFLFSDWLHAQHDISVLQDENRSLRTQLQKADEIQSQTTDALNRANERTQVCDKTTNELRAGMQTILQQVSVLEGQNRSLETENSIVKGILQGLINLHTLTSLSPSGQVQLFTIPSGIFAFALLSFSFTTKKGSHAPRLKSSSETNSFVVRVTKEERDILIARRRNHR
jgi:septal ring factor EnvC (AmiA/AmiB activator)